MQKETLNIYETTVYIFKYNGSDDAEQLMKTREGDTLVVENIVLKLEDTMKVTQILNGEIMMVPATRTRGIKYGEGFSGDNGLLEEFVIVIGEDLDEKQMLNIFLSLGVKEALVSTTPIKKLTNLDEVIGHLTVEEIHPIEKPKKRKRK